MDRNRWGRGIGVAFVAALATLAVAAMPVAARAQKPGAPAGAAPRGAAVLPKAKGLPPPTIPGSAPKVPGQAAPAMGPGAPIAGSGGSTGKGAGASVQAPAGELDEVMSFKTNFEKDVKCVPLPLNAKISVDFEEAPLYDVVKFIACITQRNFLLGTNLKQGKSVTIMSTTPVTVYEAYKAFLSALDINGLTLIPSGKFYKITETAKAKTEPVPIFGSKEDIPDEDRLITRIIALRYIDVKDLEPILNKFKTGSGDVSSYAPANSLIVTDMGRNVVRMLKFIAELDIPTGREKIWVRPVQYANATDMANLVTSLFGDKAAKGGGSAGGRAPNPSPKGAPAASAAAAASGGDTIEGPSTLSKVIADERTNQLIIVATPSAYLKIDHLLRRMDMPIEGEGQIHIYYLENAAAEDVASTLSSLTSGGGVKKAAGGKGGAAGGGGGGGAASLFAGDVKITAHKPTNSLVIESSLKDYLSVKRVIQQIDVRRKQVYVEAVIMEISSNKDRKIGLSASGGTSFNVGGNNVPLLMGMGGLGISGLDMSQLNKGGLAMGLTGPLVDVSTGTTGSSSTAGALSLPSYGFLIQAFQSNSDVNILSTPHILTTDNEEAEIVVGKTIPYQASSTGTGSLTSLLGTSGLGSLAGASTGTSALTSGLASSLLGSSLGGYGSNYVQRIDVDLTLKITPQISESNFVRLKINQQIDDVESLDATLGPTTSKRKVSNTVVVRDQQPVVIGGLMRDMEVTGVDKVPFLGDIPVLGVLFRKTAKRTEKRNLLMIITPYIIEDPSDLRRIHEQKMDEMQKFAEYMSTRKKEMAGNIDFRKKTGVLEDIRKTMERVRKDREMLEQTRFDEVDRVGAPETHDLEYDPFAPVGSAPAQGDGGASPPLPTEVPGAAPAGSVSPGAVTPPADGGPTPAAPAPEPLPGVEPAGP